MYWALEFATAAEKILYTALDQSTARYKNFTTALEFFFDAVTWIHYIYTVQRTNHLLRDSHPDQDGTKGQLTGK